jgi:membrane peptidoglycan carboxypeptidase
VPYFLAMAVASMFFVLMGIGGGTALYTLQRYNDYAKGVVPPEQLLAQLPQGGARIYDRAGPEGGNLLYEFVDEYGGLRRPVPLSEISPWIQKATVSTEDATFHENNGLNMRGLARAAMENLTPFRGDFLEGSGGSSITQQLAKAVYIPVQERYERSIPRKLKETVIALELTERYSKEQILEWYLNSISYGSVYVGIQAASEGYFSKPAKDLTLAEAALLAGIPQSPAAYEPVANPEAAKARQEVVLDLMVRHGAITEEEAAEAKAVPMEFHASRFDIKAPHFVLGPVADEIIERFGERALYTAGLEVTTTLDINLQRLGEETVEKWVAQHEATVDGHNGALMAVNPRTGEVLSYVGSRDYFRDDIDGRNNNISSLNSPGSTLKPFTYVTAFQQGWSTHTAIIDSPAKVFDPSTGREFSPRNPGGGGYHGIVSVASALGNSLNTPAFKTIVAVGVDKVLANYKQFGITQLGEVHDYGPSLTLGGVDVRLDDVTFAYSALAGEGMLRGQQPLVPHNGGERTVDPVILRKVNDAQGKMIYEFKEPVERRVMAASFAYMATSILSDGQNTCITFGCNYLDLPDRRPSARKTGTSEPFENATASSGDTWSFGYTPDLVVGVWAGNSNNSPMRNIYSTTIAWPIWRDFMAGALNHLQIPSKPFNRPPSVEERQLCWPSGKLMTDLCPKDKGYRGLVATEAIPTNRDQLAKISDTWWQRIAIDTRTGLLATSSTPAAFVSQEPRLVLPKEEVAAWSGLPAWAAANGALLAPTAESSAAAASALMISTPQSNQRVSGQVVVVGRAASPDFERYVVEWGRGKDPQSWTAISSANSPMLAGTLATWDTRSLGDGDYVLRARLVDAKLGELRFAVPVTVSGSSSGSGGNPGTSNATATITSPVAGAVITDTVKVNGTATAPRFEEFILELGEGAAPSQWTRLRRSDRQVTGGNELGELDPRALGLKEGFYTLRLSVRDEGGLPAVTQIIVNVQPKR